MNSLARSSLLMAVLLMLTMLTMRPSAAKDAKPQWLASAEKTLLGTWNNTSEKTRSIPKIDILMEKDTLKIRFWGRTHPNDSVFGPPDPLHVLSQYADVDVSTKDTTVAFATHRSTFAIKHFVLRLRDNVIHLEGITVFTDESGRSNRVSRATFARRQLDEVP